MKRRLFSLTLDGRRRTAGGDGYRSRKEYANWKSWFKVIDHNDEEVDMIKGIEVGNRLVKFSTGLALGASLLVSTAVMNYNAIAAQNTPTAAAPTPAAAG